MQHFRHIMEIAGTVVDAAGVLLVVVGALLATGRFCLQRTANAQRKAMHAQMAKYLDR